MKRQIKVATMIVAGAALLAACNNGGMSGYKTTSDGLHYKFHKQNTSGQQVQEGDVLVGEMTVKFDTMELASTNGKSERVMQALPSFPGGLYQGMLMMHVGDHATFAVEADSLAKFVQPDQMPRTYQPGKGMKFYYDLNLQEIITKEEIEQERANFLAQVEERKENEPQEILQYVRDNGITAQPNKDGLYVIVKKRGNGPKVEVGKEVSVNYTGRLLDGTIFDSSVESDARQGGVYSPQRKYEPMTYVQGRDKLIDGWEQGVLGQPAGTELQLVIPSALGYGPRGAQTIPPYSPLVFDIEIISVK
ncbi:MAG: FKBP-type peptidyl-prolyl cis-trans isomerase [Bacteroidales bacterium]|nr:FKBP-type peptidyl-prolyl cis-trans isomerase [Bacteroidales bacterium]